MNEHNRAPLTHASHIAQSMAGGPGALDGGYSQQFYREPNTPQGIAHATVDRTYMGEAPYMYGHHSPWNMKTSEFVQYYAKKWGLERPGDVGTLLTDVQNTNPALSSQAMGLAQYADTFQEWKDAMAWIQTNPHELNIRQYADLKRLIKAFRMAGIVLTPIKGFSRSTTHYLVDARHVGMFRTIMYLFGMEPDAMTCSLPSLGLYIEGDHETPQNEAVVILSDVIISDTTIQRFRKLYEYPVDSAYAPK